jgi:hypothetical protein
MFELKGLDIFLALHQIACFSISGQVSAFCSKAACVRGQMLTQIQLPKKL